MLFKTEMVMKENIGVQSCLVTLSKTQRCVVQNQNLASVSLEKCCSLRSQPWILRKTLTFHGAKTVCSRLIENNSFQMDVLDFRRLK